MLVGRHRSGPVAALALAVLSASVQSTTFDVGVQVHGNAGEFRYVLNDPWAILFSLENVYYDEHYNNTPKQAFKVTDLNGNALAPFAIPTRDPENYVLDMSFFDSGVGLRPYFRGLELTTATLRAWRMDHYKGGLSNPLYTTVMSGIAVPIAADTYMLRVDLGLHWEIEGDAINRLQQGFNTHIALAIADFQSFTLALDSGQTQGRLTADVRTTTTTATATTATVTTATATSKTVTDTSTTVTGAGREPVTDPPTPLPSPNAQPTPPPTAGITAFPTRFPTAFPTNGQQEQPKFDNEFVDCVDGKGKKGKKHKKGKKDKKGKHQYGDCFQGKEGKGKKKGKKSAKQTAITRGGLRRSGLVAATLMIFTIGMTLAVVGQRRRGRQPNDDYNPIGLTADFPHTVPDVVTPVPIRAFGTFKLDLEEAIADMRKPPARASASPLASPVRGGVNERSALSSLSSPKRPMFSSSIN